MVKLTASDRILTFKTLYLNNGAQLLLLLYTHLKKKSNTLLSFLHKAKAQKAVMYSKILKEHN